MHHDFVLVKRNRINTKNKFDKMTSNYFDKNKEEFPYVKIQDSIILYIFDSLKWLNSEFYFGQGVKLSKGINYHGVTIFREGNLVKFSKVLKCWIDLFSLGEEVLELEGSYEFSEELEYDELADLNYAGGQYEKIEIKKEVLLSQFKTLKGFLDKAIESREYCIVHLGI